MMYKKALIIFVLLAMLITVSSANPVSISSKDGLTISLSGNGTPSGAAINGASMPMLAIQGGFAFREVLTSGSNLVANHGFENGTSKPLNWSLVTINGSTPVWDNISHSGARSIKISIPGAADSKSGYPTSDLITTEPVQNYTISAWIKTQNAGGTNAPAVRVVELDSNKKWIRQTNLIFSTGTNDWEQQQITFQTSINTKWVYVYANIWNGYGTFWIDDVVLTGPLNLLANPSFESGISAPLNWSLVTVNGNTPIWDNISHSGTRSVKISIPGAADNKSGYPISDLITAEPLQYYTVSAWVKTQSAGGTNVPAFRVVELDANKRWLRQTNLIFNKGTNDWTQKQITFQTDINTSWVYVYANIWNGYGTFWVDDVKLSPVFGTTTYLSSSPVQNPDGTVTQTAQANDINFTFTYIPKDGYIQLQGDVQDLRGEDRALQIMYSLPVNANGWRWGDDIKGSWQINGSTHYENVFMIGDVREQSMYPFASVDNTNYGLSIAVPMDIPRTYRIGYNIKDGYTIQYDLGLSNQTLSIGEGYANFTFIIYKIDEPEWAFRAAAEKYYNLYPGFFTKRNSKEGLWITSVDPNIFNFTDFGFMFDESGDSHLIFNKKNGMQSFVYTEPWGWWRNFGTNSTKPSYDTLISTLGTDLSSSGIWENAPVSLVSQAVINSSPKDSTDKYYLDADYFWHRWGNVNWYQNYPTNPDPNLPYPNRYQISRNFEIQGAFDTANNTGFIDNWTTSANTSWDSTVSHSGRHSAKISILTDDTSLISGDWLSDLIPVEPNTNYTFSAWAKTKGASGGYKPAIRVIQKDKNLIIVGTQSSASLPGSDDNWILLTMQITTNQSAAFAQIKANLYRGNGTGWFDDVSFMKTGTGVNMVQNPGFENNSRGNEYLTSIDGIYIDSLNNDDDWGIIENYRRDQWSYVINPLVFSYTNRQPISLESISHYSYIDNISEEMHKKNISIQANIFYGSYGFYAHLLDILGSEIFSIESDEQSSYRRTLSYHKTNANLMQWSGSVITHNDVERYLKSEMFYAIYPSISSDGSGGLYFANSSMYERDRDLFKKYIPIIKEISEAGWEPIPYAVIDNTNIKIERYGYANMNNLYYTVRTDQPNSQTGVLTVNLDELGVDPTKISKIVVTELTSGAIIVIQPDHQFGIPVSINPTDTLVYKVNLQ